MVEGGFSRAFFAEPAVAERTVKSKIASQQLERRYYQAWGKYFQIGESITLGGNCCAANSSESMFCVAVVDPFSPLVSQELSMDIADQIG